MLPYIQGFRHTGDDKIGYHFHRLRALMGEFGEHALFDVLDGVREEISLHTDAG